MDPYQIVFDRVSDKDIVKFTLTEEGVDRVVLVSLFTIFALSFVLRDRLKRASSFRMSLKVSATCILKTSSMGGLEA